MNARAELRESLAQKLKRYSYEDLGNLGISRVADITGLDTIGIPVFTSVRPFGVAITISSGKSVTRDQARAGAILESAELQSAENPRTEWVASSIGSAPQRWENVLQTKLFQIARDCEPLLNPDCTIAFEPVDDLVRARQVWIPSDMIWFKQRLKMPFKLFQTSSNGLASGFSRKDAELAGLYECVERDAWAISEHVANTLGKRPDRVGLGGGSGSLSPDLCFILEALKRANVFPFVFDLSLIGIPVFGAHILDPKDGSPGIFGGYGCNLDSSVAISRALLEAAQARVAYISGARDDLFRRRFLLLKNIDHKKRFSQYQEIPIARNYDECCSLTFPDVDAEFTELCERLESIGVSEIYSKVLYSNQDFTVVKVITPQLETPIFEHWAPGKRSRKACEC